MVNALGQRIAKCYQRVQEHPGGAQTVYQYAKLTTGTYAWAFRHRVISDESSGRWGEWRVAVSPPDAKRLAVEYQQLGGSETWQGADTTGEDQ